jgi:hypothetical protein
MTIGVEHEAPRPVEGAGFSDAVTLAFGDPRAELYGVARLGLAESGASGLVILFAGGQPVTVSAEGGVEVTSESQSWDEVSAAGLDTTVVEPLRSWRFQFASDEASFDLEAQASGPIAELDGAHAVARTGGMVGYEQLVHVRGEARVGDARLAIDGLGQRGHSWGAPDWERIELARTVSAWLGDGVGVSLTAIRPAGKRDHAAEAVAATLLEPGEEGASRAIEIADPRLSTTYDGEGRQRNAGLELWLDDDEWPRRAAGEVVCGTSLDLGRLRLDCSFFAWRLDGREGYGRYDILRRAA